MIYPEVYTFIEHHWSCVNEWFNKYLPAYDEFIKGKDIKNILDLGANTGSILQLMIRRLVQKTDEWPSLVVAVEPNPDNVKYLLSTINGLSDFKKDYLNDFNPSKQEKHPTIYKIAECACFYSDEDSMNMSAIDNNRGGFFLSAISGEKKDSSARDVGGNVKLLSMEEIFEGTGLEHVDLAKIDIEGAEWNVLENSTFIKEKVSNIVIEIHDRSHDEASIFFATHLPMFDIKFHVGEQYFMERIKK